MKTRKMATRFASFLIAGTIFLSSCPRAEAQSKKAVADLLFKEAMTLVDQNKYAEACPKLSKSDELDPLPVTKYWLADCYEHTSRVASAWTLFIELVSASKGNPQQAQQAQQRARAIETRLPKLQINVPPGAKVEGLHIHRNGESVEEDFWGQPVPVDPGDYSITATAPGKKLWEGTRTLIEGGTASIDIPILDDLPKDTGKPPPPPPPPPPQPNMGMRYAAYGSGALGAAGLVLGAAFGLRASSKWDEALSLCNGRVTGPCDAGAAEPLDASKSAANISTTGFVVGGVGAAAFVTLFVLSRPKSAPATTGWLFVPVVDPQQVTGYARISF